MKRNLPKKVIVIPTIGFATFLLIKIPSVVGSVGSCIGYLRMIFD